MDASSLLDRVATLQSGACRPWSWLHEVGCVVTLGALARSCEWGVPAAVLITAATEAAGTFEWMRWFVIGVAILIALYTDLRYYKIHNALTLPLIISGLVVMTIHGGFGWNGLLDSLAALFVVGFPFLITYMLGGGGAGDVKLMMGIGAWSGLGLGLYLLGGVLVCGVVMVVIYGLATRQLKEIGYGSIVQVHGMLGSRRASGQPGAPEREAVARLGPTATGKAKPMPYALAIAGGVLLGGFTWSLFA